VNYYGSFIYLGGERDENGFNNNRGQWFKQENSNHKKKYFRVKG
jgi:hypothetical protein